MIVLPRHVVREKLKEMFWRVANGERVIATLDGGPVVILRSLKKDENVERSVDMKFARQRWDDVTDAVQGFGNPRKINHSGHAIVIADLTSEERSEWKSLPSTKLGRSLLPAKQDPIAKSLRRQSNKTTQSAPSRPNSKLCNRTARSSISPDTAL